MKKWLIWALLTIALTACSKAAPLSHDVATTSFVKPTITLTATDTATFTPTASPTPAPSPTPTPTVSLSDKISLNDKAVFSGETYKDYTIVKPGQKFVKTWRLTNTGRTTWNTAYFLHREAVQGHPLASAERVPLPTQVTPGETVEIPVAMKAPEKTGIYSERWTLRNPQGQIVPVGMGRYIWVIIRSCAPTGPCPSIPASSGGKGSATNQGITMKLLNFTTKNGEADASVCIVNPPTPRHMPFLPTKLLLDDKSIDISGETYIRPGCYILSFPVDPAQVQAAHSIKIVIGQIRIPGGPPDANAACEKAHDVLVKRYTGLDFVCHFSMAGYYTNLKLPAGMTKQQADQIITDAIEGAIYGHWVLKVR